MSVSCTFTFHVCLELKNLGFKLAEFARQAFSMGFICLAVGSYSGVELQWSTSELH